MTKEPVKIKLQRIKITIIQKFRLYFNWINKSYRRFAFLFFVVIPSLYIPINFFGTQMNNLLPFSTTISFVLVFHILLNASYIKSILNGGNKPYSILSGRDKPDSLDYENAIGISKYVIKAQWICGPVFIGIFAVLIFFPHSPSNIQSQFSILFLILTNVWVSFGALSLILVAHMSIHQKGKNFSLELSKAWIMSINKDMTDLEKMSHVIKCIENYDEHVDTYLKRKMSKLDQLYTKLIADNSKDINVIVDEIRKKIQTSDLALLNHLLNCIKDVNGSHLTRRESLLTRIKDNLQWFGGIIPGILAALAFLFNYLGFVD